MSQSIEEMTMRRHNRRTLLKGAAAAGLTAPFISRGARAQDPMRIAFSVPGLNFPFFVHMMNLARQHVETNYPDWEFIELDGQEAGNPSSTKQTNDIDAIIAQGVQVLVISPNDVAALAPAVQAAIDAGMVVVTVDRNVTDVPTLAHVGADNVEGGRIQGRYLIEILPEGGDVIELQGQPGAAPAIDRHAGLEEVISGQDAVKIVVSQTANFARANAVTVLEAALQTEEAANLAAVVCANDDMAFGAAEALSDAGKAVPVIGFDALPEALQAIQAGTMAATIEQFPGQQATTAIDIAIAKFVDGTDPAEHDTYLTPTIITADNLGEAERAAEAGIEPTGSPEASPTA
ncbi:MAG: substrate-binding domain-containing protein [Chloroflexota bacterium]|nr:substrate-binding domain-containing protein [Chloroflexota bacterium]